MAQRRRLEHKRVDVDLDTDLDDANIEIREIVRNSMDGWNNIAARNPHLEELARPNCDLCVLHDTPSSPTSWAETEYYPVSQTGNGNWKIDKVFVRFMPKD